MEQNYLPLFRKYRPQSFSDIVGQESLVKALSNAIELKRIANAYLFCGPRGTGKTSTARILAKSLNCEHGPTLEPCQKCASCIDITNATGLDVIEIDAASNRGIQDAKGLIAQVQYAPIHGKYKIFIIDEVHMLSNDAFNALLKTFEEPPKNVIFILATTEPHKVLETIVSRCQRFDLRRITTADIVARLRKIADIEQIKINDEALFTIAKNVSGGLRDSLALLDQVSILGVREEIGKDLIEELLGKINLDILLKLLNNIVKEDIENTLLTIDEIYSKGNEPRNLAENFIEFLRNTILVLSSNNNENIKSFTSLIDEDIEKIKSYNFDKDKIIKILNTLIEYYKEIKISTNPYLWMELACIASAKLDLLSTKPTIPTNSQTIAAATALSAYTPIKPSTANKPTSSTIENTPIANTPSADSTPATPKPIPSEAQQKENTQSETTAPLQVENQIKKDENTAFAPEIAKNQDGAEIWLNIIAAIPSLPTRALYSGTAKLVSVQNQKITLGFTHENALNQAKSSAKLSVLQSTVDSKYPGYSVEFIKITPDTKIIEVKASIAPRPQPQNQFQNQARPSGIEEPITKTQSSNKNFEQEENTEQIQKEKKYYSPKVQDMIEQFSGKIIED